MGTNRLTYIYSNDNPDLKELVRKFCDTDSDAYRTVIFKGRSGCGKSALLKYIASIYEEKGFKTKIIDTKTLVKELLNAFCSDQTIQDFCREKYGRYAFLGIEGIEFLDGSFHSLAYALMNMIKELVYSNDITKEEHSDGILSGRTRIALTYQEFRIKDTIVSGSTILDDIMSRNLRTPIYHLYAPDFSQRQAYAEKLANTNAVKLSKEMIDFISMEEDMRILTGKIKRFAFYKRFMMENDESNIIPVAKNCNENIETLFGSSVNWEHGLDNLFVYEAYYESNASETQQIYDQLDTLAFKYGNELKEIYWLTHAPASIKELAEASRVSLERTVEIIQDLVCENLVVIYNSPFMFKGKNLREAFPDVILEWERFMKQKSGGIMIVDYSHMDTKDLPMIYRLFWALAHEAKTKYHRGVSCESLELFVEHVIGAVRSLYPSDYLDIYFSKRYPDMVLYDLDFTWRGHQGPAVVSHLTELLESSRSGRHFVITTRNWPSENIPDETLKKLLETAVVVDATAVVSKNGR